MTPDKIYAELVIWSKILTPDEITTKVGMACDESWKIGDRRCQNSLPLHKYNKWRVNSGLPTTAPMEDHVVAILDKVGHVSKNIKKLSVGTDVQICCVAYYYEDYNPQPQFDKYIIERIAALGASLDFDLYFLGSDED